MGRLPSANVYRIVGIYYKSLNFAKFAISNALAIVKVSTFLDPYIFYMLLVVDKIVDIFLRARSCDSQKFILVVNSRHTVYSIYIISMHICMVQ